MTLMTVVSCYSSQTTNITGLPNTEWLFFILLFLAKTIIRLTLMAAVSSTTDTAVPINNLLALHKQYTDCPSNLAGYEAENLYKRLLFIRNML